MIHIVTGLVGTGKSEATRLLHEKLGALVVTTDDLRHLVFPGVELTQASDVPAAINDEIYRSLGLVAHYLAKAAPDRHFAFEGVFRAASQLTEFTRILEAIRQPFRVILMETEERLAIERIKARHARGDHPATSDTYYSVKRDFEMSEGAWRINNSGSLADLSLELDRYLSNLPPTQRAWG